MAREFKLGIIVTGDGKGGVAAVRATNAELKALQTESKKARDATRGLSADQAALASGARQLKGALQGALAGFTAGSIFKSFLTEAAGAERSVTKINAVLKATGGISGQTSASLQKMAGEMQDVTEFSDDAVMAAQAVMLTFNKIGGDVFPRAIRTSADLAAVLETDLSGASRILGKALQDPAEGLGVLTKQGIRFDEATKDNIESLVKAGRAAEAQGLILDELERRVGGVAEAMRNDLAGAVSGAKHAFGELLEGDGSTGALKASIVDLTATLKDPQVKEGFDNIATGIANVAQWAVLSAAWLANAAKATGEWAAEATLGMQGMSGDVRQSLARATDSVTNFKKALQDPFATNGDIERLSAGLKTAEERVRALRLEVEQLDLDNIYTAVMPVLDNIERITNPQLFAAPLIAAADATIPFANNLDKATAAGKRGAEMTEEQRKALEEMRKAIQNANKSVDDQIRVQTRTLELIHQGIDADTAAKQAKMELDRVTQTRIQTLFALDEQVKAHNETQAENVRWLQASLKAEEDLRNAVNGEVANVSKRIAEQQRINQLLLTGMDIKIAEKRVAIEFADINTDELRILREKLDLLEQQNEAIVTGREAATEAAEKAAEDYRRAADDINRSLTDALLRGFESGKDFAENFRDTLKNMFMTLVLRPLIEPIVKPVSDWMAQLTGGGTGTGSGGGINLGSLASMFGGGASTTGTYSASAAAGTSGLGTYSASTGASSAAGGVSSMLGQAGFYYAAFEIGSALGNALVGKWKVKSKDISLDFANDAVNATIKTVKAQKHLIGGDHTKTSYAEPTNLDAQLTLQFKSAYDVIEEAGSRLGASLDDFTFKLKGDIKGLEGDALAAKIDEMMDEATEALGAQVIPNITRWRGENESAIEAVVRLTNETLAYRGAANNLGLTLRDGTQVSVDASQRLAEHAGGMQNLLSSMDTFYQNFFSETERQANATANLEAEMARLGVALPPSEDGFRNLALGIDQGTVAGEKLFVSLMGLSGAAAAFYQNSKLVTAALDAEAAWRRSLAITSGLNVEDQNAYIASLQLEGKTKEQLIEITDQAALATGSYYAAIAEGMQALKAQIREVNATAKAAFEDSIKVLGTADLSVTQFIQNLQGGAYNRADDSLGRSRPSYFATAQRDFERSSYYLGTLLGPQGVLVKAVLSNITAQTDLTKTLGELGSMPLGDILNGYAKRRDPLDPTGEYSDSQMFEVARKEVVRIQDAEAQLAAQRDAGIISIEAYDAAHAALAADFERYGDAIETYKQQWAQGYVITSKFLDDLFGQIQGAAGILKDAGAEIVAPIKAATGQLTSIGDAFDAVTKKLWMANPAFDAGRIAEVAAAQERYNAALEASIVNQGRAGQAYFDRELSEAQRALQQGQRNAGIGDSFSAQYRDDYLRAGAAGAAADAIKAAIEKAFADSMGVTGTTVSESSNLAQLLAGVEKGDSTSLQNAYLRLTSALGQYDKNLSELAYGESRTGQYKDSRTGEWFTRTDEQGGITIDQYDDLIEQALDLFTGAADEFATALSEGTDAARSMIADWEGVLEPLQDFRKELMYGDAANLTAKAQYDALKVQFEQTKALAATSDIDAQREYIKVGQEFLRASTALNGAGGAYEVDRQSVLAGTDTAIDIARSEIELQQQQVDALKAIEASNLSATKKLEEIEKLLGDLVTVTSGAATQNNRSLAAMADELSVQNTRRRAAA